MGKKEHGAAPRLDHSRARHGKRSCRCQPGWSRCEKAHRFQRSRQEIWRKNPRGNQFRASLDFLFGFEKSERANISKAELKALQELAKNLLGFNATQIVMAVRERQLIDLKRLEE